MVGIQEPEKHLGGAGALFGRQPQAKKLARKPEDLKETASECGPWEMHVGKEGRMWKQKGRGG